MSEADKQFKKTFFVIYFAGYPWRENLYTFNSTLYFILLIKGIYLNSRQAKIS